MDIGLFSRHIIDKYLLLKEKNGIPFVTIYTMGFRQARIPYRRMARTAGKSGWPFWKRLRFAIDVLVDYSYTPIRLITFTGTIIAALSFLYGALLIMLKLFFNKAGDGWTSLATMIAFIGGVQMIFLGVIVEYLWRTSRNAKSQPTFYIMDVIRNHHDEHQAKL